MNPLQSAATRTLRWTAGPVAFELSADDPRVFQRATEVFGPWLEETPSSSRPWARFRIEAFRSSGRQAWRVERRGFDPSTVESLDRAIASVEYGSVAALQEPGSGIVSLHAALLSRADRGLLIVGPKEAGKSTLACALWAAGWHLHSDDNAVLENASARGIPRRVSLRRASRALLGPDLWKKVLDEPGTTRTRGGILFHPTSRRNGAARESVPVVGVLFLKRRGASVGPARIERLDPGRALLSLAPYCNRREAGLGQALADLQPLADRARSYDLGRGELSAMIAGAEEVLRP